MQGVKSILARATASLALVLAFGCSSSPMNEAKPGGSGGGSNGSGGAPGGSPGTGGATTSDAGGGGAPPEQFPSEALSTFMTPDDALKIELRTSPAQPIYVGPDNEGELRISDSATGDPVDGLSIGVSTWMPVMGHKCAEVPVHVKALGGGAYLLTPLVASMPGKCELKLSISMPLPDGGKGKSVAVVSPTFDVTESE